VNQLTILPMAFVMVAGPQILSAIFLATSKNWQRNTAAYLAGAALSITLIVSIAYLLSSGAPREGGSNDTVNAIILVLLLAAMVHVFLARKTSAPPKWMGRLQTASPRFSFRLGFLLLGCSQPTSSPRLPWAPTCPATAIPDGTCFPSCCSRCCLCAAGAPRARVRQTGAGLPSQGMRLDECQFVARQRDRARVLHRHHHQQPGGVTGHPLPCHPVRRSCAGLRPTRPKRDRRVRAACERGGRARSTWSSSGMRPARMCFHPRSSATLSSRIMASATAVAGSSTNVVNANVSSTTT
jgi:hypothetical protein